MAPRVVFQVMEPGVDRIGLRCLRREFGAYGEIFCASLRLDRFRHAEGAEIEFMEAKSALKLKAWDGSGSDLALYRAEDSLVDASRRDEQASFLCNIDGFGQGAAALANSFADLKVFANYVTDECCVTIRGASLNWSPGRGVYAQVYCEQKADQERTILKLSEPYLGRRLSCSSMCGSEYAGVSEGGYRVDWAQVGTTIHALGDRLRVHAEDKASKKEAKEAKKAEKKAKLDKKEMKGNKDKKGKKGKKEKKDKTTAKEKNKEKQSAKEKEGNKKQKRSPSESSSSSASPAKSPEVDSARQLRERQAVRLKPPPHKIADLGGGAAVKQARSLRGPMALLGE